MRIEIRLFLGIDAFSKISGMAFACSAVSSPLLAKQPLDSATVASEGCRVPRGKRLTSPPKALFENPRFAPRIRRFCVPANSHATGKLQGGPPDIRCTGNAAA